MGVIFFLLARIHFSSQDCSYLDSCMHMSGIIHKNNFEFWRIIINKYEYFILGGGGGWNTQIALCISLQICIIRIFWVYFLIPQTMDVEGSQPAAQSWQLPTISGMQADYGLTTRSPIQSLFYSHQVCCCLLCDCDGAVLWGLMCCVCHRRLPPNNLNDGWIFFREK